MRHDFTNFEHAPLPYLAKWMVLATAAGILAGSASAFLLWTLDWCTRERIEHEWLLALLPLAGFSVGWIYLRIGQHVEAGHNLLIDEIHNPTRIVPLRMAPLVLGGTLVSHLFGASVGREGTAVQMGGALADQITYLLHLGRTERRILLMAGISAGFASVFGAPLAGAVFGLEVLAIGRLRYDAILPCAVAAVVAHEVCLAWGIHHTPYAIAAIPSPSLWLLTATVIAGSVFGLTGRLFAAATHALTDWMTARVRYAPLRPLLGGAVVALAAWALHAERFIGLGVPVIVDAFKAPVGPFDWLAKTAFTVVSLGTGFKGGEVTPLFFIGATLGNVLAPVLRVPFPLLAGVGFVAVFAGAANTPISSTLMAMELFGSGAGVYALIGCVVSYLFSGHSGIYRAQRIEHAKHGIDNEPVRQA
jgi:H+/Cl- antiporter ClcA